MGIKLGLDAALYYGDSGTTADTLVENVRDLTLNLTSAEADVTTRGADGWRQTVATLKDGSISFQIVWDTDDDFFTALKTAWLANTMVAMLILDAPIADSGQGLDADMIVSSFTRNEALEDALMVDVEMKPGYATRAPSWYTAS